MSHAQPQVIINSSREFLPYRDKLIKLVNSNRTFGHLFLADPIRFVNEHLGIGLTARAEKEVREDYYWAATSVSQKDYEAIQSGKKAVYGVDTVFLEPEECACDEPYDFSNLEIKNPKQKHVHRREF